MEILCSFRLVIEGKTGKEIPESSRLEFSEKFLENNFTLSDEEDNTSVPLNRGSIADLPLLRTLVAIHQKSREPSFSEVMNSFVLLVYASLAASRTFSNDYYTKLYFRFRWFILLVQTKKMISMNYGSNTSCWKPWRLVTFDLILTMRDIYTNSNLNPLTKFTSSSRSIESKDIFLRYISQIITKTIPISTRIVINYAMKRGILFWVCWKVNENWDNNMIRISQRRDSHCRTNTSVTRKKYILKCRTVRATVRVPSRKVNHLSKIIWDSKIITGSTRSITSTRIS